MDVLWERPGLTPADIHAALNEKESLAYTTVHTELTRLVQKHLIRRDGEARYFAALSREDYAEQQIATVLDGLIQAHGAAAIHGFVDLVSTEQRHLDILKDRLRGSEPQ